MRVRQTVCKETAVKTHTYQKKNSWLSVFASKAVPLLHIKTSVVNFQMTVNSLSPIKTLIHPNKSLQICFLCLSDPHNICFVCVEVLRPSQPNGVMSSAVSLPNHTFTGQA